MAGEHILPNPSGKSLEPWQKRLTPDQLHDAGWDEVNSRQHGIARQARIYALRNYASNPDARQQFLDGVAFGVVALLRTHDSKLISDLLSSESGPSEFPELLDRLASAKPADETSADANLPPEALPPAC
jgi:hypothetical protein